VNSSYEYKDEKAVAWAIDHNMPNLLRTDKTAFKKLCGIQSFDFVKKSESPVAVVSFED
jgi:hypothetical protein